MTAVEMDLLELLKVEGQERSVRGVSEGTQGAFFEVLRTVPVGQSVSVNTVRVRLDAAGIPASARGGLFAAAVRYGLLEKSMVPNGRGGYVQDREPSTGASAHLATVVVYRRTDPPVREG